MRGSVPARASGYSPVAYLAIVIHATSRPPNLATTRSRMSSQSFSATTNSEGRDVLYRSAHPISASTVTHSVMTPARPMPTHDSSAGSC